MKIDNTLIKLGWAFILLFGSEHFLNGLAHLIEAIK